LRSVSVKGRTGMGYSWVVRSGSRLRGAVFCPMPQQSGLEGQAAPLRGFSVLLHMPLARRS